MNTKHGYVPVAPACGDCHHCLERPQNMFCRKHHMPVLEGGRCLQWMPSAEWQRANPVLQRLYRPQDLCNVVALSPAEAVYLTHMHALH